MESEFAGNLVVAPSRSPTRKSFGGHRDPSQSHASANSRKLFVFACVKKSSLVIRIKTLAHDATFEPQREKDHHQCDNERRTHDKKKSHKEARGAVESRCAVPGSVQG